MISFPSGGSDGMRKNCSIKNGNLLFRFSLILTKVRPTHLITKLIGNLVKLFQENKLIKTRKNFQQNGFQTSNPIFLLSIHNKLTSYCFRVNPLQASWFFSSSIEFPNSVKITFSKSSYEPKRRCIRKMFFFSWSRLKCFMHITISRQRLRVPSLLQLVNNQLL